MSDKITALASAQTDAPISVGTADMLFAPGMYQALKSFAVDMAKGLSTLPKHLQGNPADCMAVTMQAAQWKMNPFAVAQKTHLVSGTLGYEAQLVNAVITSMAPTKDRLHYDWFGPWDDMMALKPDARSSKEGGCGVRVWATLKGEDEPRELSLLMSQATVRNSPLWKTDPKQQLAYLAVKRWARLYTPDVILGVYTPDELAESDASGPRDMGKAEVVDQGTAPAPASRTDALKAKVKDRQAVPPEPAQPDLDAMIETLEACESDSFLDTLKSQSREIYGALDPAGKGRLTKAIKAAEERLAPPEPGLFDKFMKDAGVVSDDADADALRAEVQKRLMPAILMSAKPRKSRRK